MERRRFTQVVLISLALLALAVLLFRRLAVFLLPLFFFVPLHRSKQRENLFTPDDDDPADWWKRGKRRGEA